MRVLPPRGVKRYAAHVGSRRVSVAREGDPDASRGVLANTVRLALAPVNALLATAVEEGLIRSNPAAVLRIAETVKARRDASLTEQMARRLWATRAAVKARDEALVFPASSGEQLDYEAVHRAVTAAGKRPGVPWTGLHTLRHIAATLAFRSGWNAVQVQRFLEASLSCVTLAV